MAKDYSRHISDRTASSRFGQIVQRVCDELAHNTLLRNGLWLVGGGVLLVNLLYVVYNADDVPEAISDAPGGLILESKSPLWKAPNGKLAQERLRGAVAGLIGGLDVKDLRIDVWPDRPAPQSPAVQRVQVYVDGQLSLPNAMQFVQRISGHPEPLLVDRLSLIRRDETVTLHTALSAYFKLDEDG